MMSLEECFETATLSGSKTNSLSRSQAALMWCSVRTNDGTGEKRYHMSRSYYGLYVPHMTWRAIDNFSTNSVALVLSSTCYEPSDYIEDFNEFLKLKNG